MKGKRSQNKVLVATEQRRHRLFYDAVFLKIQASDGQSVPHSELISVNAVND